LLLIDDPIKNRQEAESETIRDNVWDWFRSVAYPTLMPDGCIVIITTR
jgi:predicted phage terminase large subunit-like protein